MELCLILKDVRKEILHIWPFIFKLSEFNPLNYSDNKK